MGFYHGFPGFAKSWVSFAMFCSFLALRRKKGLGLGFISSRLLAGKSCRCLVSRCLDFFGPRLGAVERVLINEILRMS